eukprot:TRINITY_DN3024_c0_g1_i1.p1 TRINITY_DN3024_c0_g1~~TRINITY_DN3024_c0_g1_i1.p1  ORF type:complete len:206 (-),score=78.80 TRINITY_DN3024_c0_g1_i1:233-850(-)
MMVADEDLAKEAPAAQKLAGGVATAAAIAAKRAARYAADQRALLFGSRLGKSAEAQRQGQLEAERVAEQERRRAEQQALMEERNDELVDHLHEKVTELKEVVQETKQEVSASTQVVDLLNKGTDGVLSQIHWAQGRVRDIAKEPAWRNSLLLTVFFVFMLILMYVIGTSGLWRQAATAAGEAAGEATEVSKGFLASLTHSAAEKR